MKRFFMKNVKQLGGRNLIPLDRQDKVGVLRQVLNRLFRNALGQFNGNDLLLIRNHNGGISYDQIQRGECRLNTLNPFSINAFAHKLAR